MGRCPRSGVLRSADAPADLEASVALPGVVVFGADVDRTLEFLDAQVVLTRRTGAEACRRVGELACPVSHVAGRVRGVLGDDHERRGRARHPRSLMILIVSVGSASWVSMRRRCCARTGIITRSTRPVSSTSKAVG